MTEQELRDKQKIVLLLTQMQAKLDAAEQKAHQPIAVIGMSCRMPGDANSADSFWAMLEAGTDAVVAVPPGRWDADSWYDPDPDAPGKMNTRRGGFLQGVDKFDAEFFGISPREAISMDPQQRLVLEVAWRALEHANVRPQSLAGSRTGVFLGICTSDYARMGDGSGSMGALDTYSGTGGANGVAAGRLSYTLGLQGPSMVVDTACSSSLVASHLAVQSLRSGECRLALAGGVNLVLLPDGTVTLSRLHMMAPDGRCKAFDAAADGFVRGEGCGIVVLKRLADAQADGDTVLAVIRGSAVNQDGRSAGLTAPNGLAQQAVVREALANARVNPADIAYVEAHGTGTALGDPVEINALAAVLGQGRSRPLLVGSVKTNIGHLEAAAGVAGLIKAIETVRRGRVAPSLHFHNINPHIQTGNCEVQVPTAAVDLAAGLPRLAGVSAFGFSGTNAHMVLEAPPSISLPQPGSPQALQRAEVLPLSARTAAALAELKNGIASSPSLEQFADACFTAATGRSTFAHRLAIVADSGAAAIEQLKTATGRAAASPRIAFLFSGQGAQASGMGQFQYQNEPVFRAVIDRCAAVLDPLLGRSLTGLMFHGGAELNRTEYAQPALMAFELAMVELLRSWGVEPEVLLGHSLGEYVAATVAESLPFDEALRLVALRGRLMQALPAGGAMAAVLAGREALAQVLAMDPLLAVAADNGPAMVTIAGPEQSVQAACLALQARGIESRRLPVSHAFHSALMEPALADIEAAAARVGWRAPRIPLISNLDGQPMACPDAAYWRRHTREPVAFAAGVREMALRGCNVFVEIGPNPVLLGMARSCVAAMPASPGASPVAIEWIASSRLGQDASGMQALARLFEAGVDLRWDRVHAGRGRRHVDLPGHPMRRVSYWRTAAALAAEAGHPLLATRVDLADGRTVFKSRLPDAALAPLAEHRVAGQAIAPAALLLEACACAALRRGHAAALSAISFAAPLPLDGAREVTIELDAAQVSLQSRKPEGGVWTVHLQANLGGAAPAAQAVDSAQAPHAVDPLALHQWMQAGGIEYGPVFRRIQQASRGAGVALAQLAPIASAPYSLHPALLDAAFQALAVASFETGDGLMRIPVGLDHFEIGDAPASGSDAAWAHVRLAGEGAQLSADVWLCDVQGRTLARAHGLRLAAPGGRAVATASWQDWLLERQWRSQALPLVTQELAQHAAAGFATAPVQAALGALDGLGLAMDRLAAIYAAQALASVPPDTVAHRHQALYRRLPLLALPAGPQEEALAQNPDVLLAELHRQYPGSARELSLLQRCGSQLAAVLQGRQDPLQLLFPADNEDNVYRDSPVSRALNRAVEDAVMAALPASGPLRILEVGAGTGGTTDGLLQRLPAARMEEYAFTDISAGLLAAAGRRHAALPWLQPRRFDIDQDPLAQGFAAGRYDIILAANVIHAGADLKRSLQGLARLLAPNGVLVMLEGAGPQGWIDLVFGLTEGWWRFTDHERRLDYPVPGRAGWLQVLQEAGLGASVVEASAGDVLERQVILVARHSPAGKWLVAGGDDDLSLALAGSLGTPHVAADEALPPGAWQGCVFTGALQMAADPDGLELLMADQQRTLEAQRQLALACSERGMQLVVLTCGAHAASAVQATAWGLGRAIAAELPDVGLRLIDIDPELAVAQAVHGICSELDCRDGEDQLALTTAGRQVARLQRLQPSGPALVSPAVLDPSAAYLITGGFGGLGLHSAAWLVQRGARCLVLMGRSSPSLQAQEQITRLQADGVEVYPFIGDVAVQDDVVAALAAPARRMAGVVHAAGALDDGVLAQLDWPRMERVLRAKLAGAWLLDRLAGPLDFFLLYSSAVGLAGSRGQANHVAANAYLDALAAKRRMAGQAAASIAWGAWSDIGSATGMQLHRRMQQSGMDTIAPAQGTHVLDWTLDSATGTSQAPAPAAFGVLPVRWQAFAQALGTAVPPVLRELVPALPRSGLLPAPALALPVQGTVRQQGPASAAAPVRPMRMLDLLLTEAAAVLAADGPGAIDPDRSLFELGLDSLMAVELRNRVQLKLGRSLPSTLLFDHPTPSGLAAFLGDEAAGDAAIESPRAASHEPIAIIGMDCRFPGGASNPERFWQLLCEAYDAIGGYPADRHSEAIAPGRQGAFLADVDRFDAAFFRIAPREAASMDPQQRLLLETAWHALERAGQAPDQLAGSSTGVFVGVCNYDYPQLVAAAGQVDAWTATGGAPSIVAGRLAYVLGLEGPAMVVDTACSSSLVSVHLACQSLLAGDCSMALAGGVNLILTTSSTEALSTLHMLAPDARCKTFDSRADGFVRGEGCGVIVLKRLSDALAHGDPVLAVIAGSHVNQDGRSPSLTAPSGRSQENVIRQAQARAGVLPEQVAYIETHGTGTQLGDPIEIHALRAVFGAERTQEQALVVGAVKSNIGHLEAAAGIAGLIKATLAVAHARIPPNLHFRQINPHIQLDGLAIRFPSSPVDWPLQGQRVAGVSAFGFSGTNAHIVLKQADTPAARPPLAAGQPQLLLVSGATPEAARSYAQALAARLLADHAPSLADLAYTLLAGRAQLEWRIAVVASNAAEAASALQAAEPQAAPVQPVSLGFVLRGRKLPTTAVLQALDEGQPTWRMALDEVDQLLPALQGWPVGRSIRAALFEAASTGVGAVPNFAFAYASCRLLATWGLLPQAFVVEGCGRQVAACLAQTITLAEALAQVLQAKAAPLAQDGPAVVPADDVEAVSALGCDVLLAIDADTAALAAGSALVLGMCSGQSLADMLAVLHLAGCRLAPDAMRAAGATFQTDVPVYPFQSGRHWVGPALVRLPVAALQAGKGQAAAHPLLGALQRSPGPARRYQSQLSTDLQPWLAQHRVAGAATLPAAAMIEIMLATGAPDKAVAIGQIEFDALLDLSEPTLLQTELADSRISLYATPARADDWREISHAELADAIWPAAPAQPLHALQQAMAQPLDVDMFYSGFEQAGALAYGPAFRTISSLYAGQVPGQCLARLVLPDGLDASAMRLHPALLDGAFQSIGAAVASLPSAAETGAAYLPTGVQRFVCAPASALYEAWAWTSLQQGPGGVFYADIELFSAQGEVLASVHKLLLRPSRSNSGRRAFVHELQWHAAEAGRSLPRRWHFMAADAHGHACMDGLANRLLGSGHTLVPMEQAQGVVFFAGMQPGDAMQPSAAVLGLAQQLVRLEQAPQLWLVTCGEASATGGKLAATTTPAGSALWGLAASLRLEHPELSVTVIDLSEDLSGSAMLEQALACHGAVLSARSDGVFVRVPVLAEVQPLGGSFALQRPDSGQVHALAWAAAPAPVAGPGQVAIAVAVAGLNFRDLMNVLGTYPGAAGLLGGECAGYVTAIGAGVSGLNVGQPVMAISAGCQASHVLAPAPLVLPLPQGWSLEQAGTSPTVFLTAAWALRGPGTIAAGQRVLVHAGTGGLGLAAIQIARAAGAEVLATAGSEEKRAYLHAMGVACVSDSRSLAFVDAVRAFTGGQGVDIVLNALSGELIAGGFELLRPGGRFLEVGKAGIWTDSQASACRADVLYHRIALDEQIVSEPEVVGQMWRGLLAEFDKGLLTPLPVTPFAMEDAAEAYRFMQHARHTGRIALSRRWLRRDAAYLVTGGTGALGLACAAWLIERGAGKVVLAGRSLPDAHVDARLSAELARLSGMGAVLEFMQADVADRAQVERLVASVGAPLAGVIHAAGVLDDGVMLSQTPERMAAVFAPKVLGALHLDAATRAAPLDFFVMFSSAAGVLGSAGQSNYAAANAALDGIAGQRRALGLPALSIDWGAWAGAGLAAEAGVRRAMPAMAAEHALAALENLLKSGASQALVMPEAIGQALPGQPAAAQAGPAEPTDTASGLQAELVAASSGERLALVASAVRREAATILSLPAASLKAQRALGEYGLDSLMAVELRNALAALAGTRLPSSLLFDYPSIEALAAFLFERMGLAHGAKASDAVQAAAPAALVAPPTDEGSLQPDINNEDALADDELTEDALAEILRKELDRAGY